MTGADREDGRPPAASAIDCTALLATGSRYRDRDLVVTKTDPGPLSGPRPEQVTRWNGPPAGPRPEPARGGSGLVPRLAPSLRGVRRTRSFDLRQIPATGAA
ncbi:protein of unknown function [Modestobacter italicus]|uniref:Uncharacterized protein n=1 Tax=Modestobacter italicus (strain DSM 44449 / CECT 9708 / BC 501) TaxID=2732864 RepID=I4F221_MODI5|nr:protein of unknown function [Modestobacter marinus]